MSASAITAAPAAAPTAAGTGLGRRLLRNPRIVGGLVVVAILLVLAAFGPQIAPYNPLQQHLVARLKPVGWRMHGQVFWAGTDQFGRDVLSRLIVGLRIPLLAALCSAVLGGLIGTAAGLLAGYRGGWVDVAIGLLIDTQLALPFILVGLLVMVLFGPSAQNIVLVFTFMSWPIAARTARAQAASIATTQFVEACRVAGGSHLRILLRHVLPNAVSPVIVVMTVQVANFIIYEAALGFFGLGIPPPEPTWGNMLADSRNYLTQAWWLGLLPGLCIAAVAFTATTLGEGLRQVLDPRHAQG